MSHLEMDFKSQTYIVTQTGSQFLLGQSTIGTELPCLFLLKTFTVFFQEWMEVLAWVVCGLSELIEKNLKGNFRTSIAPGYFQKYIHPGSISSKYYTLVAQHPSTTTLFLNVTFWYTTNEKQECAVQVVRRPRLCSGSAKNWTCDLLSLMFPHM